MFENTSHSIPAALLRLGLLDYHHRYYTSLSAALFGITLLTLYIFHIHI